MNLWSKTGLSLQTCKHIGGVWNKPTDYGVITISTLAAPCEILLVL